jgi:hypothetical protein
VFAGRDLSHVLERAHQTYHAVAAHAEVAYVVEEDDAAGGPLVYWLAQHRAHDGIVPTRLPHDGRTEIIVIPTEQHHSFCHRPGPQSGKPRDHDTGWFTACVRVDCLYPVLGGHREAERQKRKYNAFETPPEILMRCGSLTI